MYSIAKFELNVHQQAAYSLLVKPGSTINTYIYIQLHTFRGHAGSEYVPSNVVIIHPDWMNEQRYHCNLQSLLQLFRKLLSLRWTYFGILIPITLTYCIQSISLAGMRIDNLYIFYAKFDIGMI